MVENKNGNLFYKEKLCTNICYSNSNSNYITLCLIDKLDNERCKYDVTFQPNLCRFKCCIVCNGCPAVFR